MPPAPSEWLVLSEPVFAASIPPGSDDEEVKDEDPALTSTLSDVIGDTPFVGDSEEVLVAVNVGVVVTSKAEAVAVDATWLLVANGPD